jgi:hypothetical protein
LREREIILKVLVDFGFRQAKEWFEAFPGQKPNVLGTLSEETEQSKLHTRELG